MQGNSEDESGSEVAIQESVPKLGEPPKFAVVMHNDDFTTMEFVIEVLEHFFRRTRDEAMAIMLRIHNQGSGVAGLFPYDIAETKVAQVGAYAQSKGFPLKCTVEPA